MNRKTTMYLPIAELPPHPVRWVIYSGNTTHNSWVLKSSRLGKRLMRERAARQCRRKLMPEGGSIAQ